MKYSAGILHHRPQWNPLELVVLALTPGMPLEWIYSAAGLGWRRRRKLLDLIAAYRSDELLDMARENAASVVQGDGFLMLEVVCPRYSGPAPLWSQFDLQNDRRSDAAIAAVLGVSRKKFWRWRTNAVFDPLTGARLVPNRGVPIF